MGRPSRGHSGYYETITNSLNNIKTTETTKGDVELSNKPKTARLKFEMFKLAMLDIFSVFVSFLKFLLSFVLFALKISIIPGFVFLVSSFLRLVYINFS